MNNVIMGRVLPFLITLAIFSGECAFASQASSGQIQSSSDSDHGGRSLKDQEDAQVLVKQGNALYQRSATLLKQNDKKQAYVYLINSGEKYAAAVILRSGEALEKLVEVAHTLLEKLFIKEAREFFADAARFGHEEAQKQYAALANNSTNLAIPLKTQESETVLIFNPSVCQTFMDDIRLLAREKQKTDQKTERKE